ncbi:hypothetical protein B0H13DRAFT_2358076 [Mycena leptocephala]|nr:hypothetical protein B0H13DRAFT_2358076 [Mycena leptocephala]
MKAGFPHLVLVLTFLGAVAGRIALTVALAVLRSRMPPAQLRWIFAVLATEGNPVIAIWEIRSSSYLFEQRRTEGYS